MENSKTVEKFASISRKIPWFLGLKTAGFLAALVILVPEHPVWFWIAALSLYLFPRFQAARYGGPFLIIGCTAFFAPHSIWVALLFSACFFILLGMKEMVFVRRFPAYQAFFYLSFFLLALAFFFNASAWGGDQVSIPLAFLWALVLPAGFFLLARGLKNEMGETASSLGDDEVVREETVQAGGMSREGSLVFYAALLAFLMWQLSLALLFLPLDFLRQSALIFLAGVVFVEVFSDHAKGTPHPENFLTLLVPLLTLFGIILLFAPWEY